MHHYQLFGRVLGSEIEIPELAASEIREDPDWILRCNPVPSRLVHGELLGTDTVTGDVLVRAYRQHAGLRLAFDDTGTFDISGDGREITWWRPHAPTLGDARADLTGRVLAAALHLQGILSLHASAVVLPAGAIGMIAPKRHGKSTLALALVASGARLLTDDTLPVSAGSPPIAHPGLHATRLWPDSAAKVGLGEQIPSTEGEKQLFRALPAERTTQESAPLLALYLLAPVRKLPDGSAVRRARMAPVRSALSMVGHSKLAPLLTGSEGPVLFSRATGLSMQVPVFRLEVVRDLERLDEVVTMMRGWHAAPD